VLTLGGGSNGIPVTEKTANSDKMARAKTHRRILLLRQGVTICSKQKQKNEVFGMCAGAPQNTPWGTKTVGQHAIVWHFASSSAFTTLFRMPCPQYDIFVLLSEIYIIVISF